MKTGILTQSLLRAIVNIMRFARKPVEKRLPRLEELVLYILANYNDHRLTETKLHKLLYYCDFNSYEKSKEAISEGTYMNNNFGPTLKELGMVLNSLEKRGMIKKLHEKNLYGDPQTRYTITSDEGLKFSFDEDKLETIKNVNETFRPLLASQLSAMSHFDTPVLLAGSEKELNYEDVFHRDDEFSVSEEERKGWSGFLTKEDQKKLIFFNRE